MAQLLIALPTNTEKVDRLNERSAQLLRNQPLQSQVIAEQSLALAEGIDYFAGMAQAYLIIGNADLALGFIEDALADFNASLQICNHHSLKATKADLLRARGNLFLEQDDFESATKNYEQGLILYRELGDSLGVAKLLNNFGTMYSTQGDNKRSIQYFIAASDLFRLNGQEALAGTAYSNIGTGYTELKEYRKADLFFDRAMRVFTQNKDIRGMGVTYQYRQINAFQQGHYKEAIDYGEKSLFLLRPIPHYAGIAAALAMNGAAYARLKKTDAAIKSYQEALEFSRMAKNPIDVIQELTELAKIYQELGDVAKEQKCLEDALQAVWATSEKEVAIEVNMMMADFFMRQRLYEQALPKITLCIEMIEHGEVDPKTWHNIYDMAAKTYTKLRQLENAAAAKAKYDAPPIVHP